MDGFFLIYRGNDEVGIENAIAAGNAGQIQTNSTTFKISHPISMPSNDEVPIQKAQVQKPNAPPQPAFPPQFSVNFTIPSCKHLLVLLD